MNKKELFFKIGIIPSLILLISFISLFIPSAYSRYERSEVSAVRFFLDFIFNYDNQDVRIGPLIISLMIFFIIASLYFRYMLSQLNKYLGFPSLSEANKYFHEKNLIEKKKRLLAAKANHESRMIILEEEKKKYS
jgi:hypothetical protein